MSNSPVVLYSKAAKATAHGKKGIRFLEAKTQKLADFSVSGGFDVPDHPPGLYPLLPLPLRPRSFYARFCFCEIILP